jgi:hypothetical protein
MANENNIPENENGAHSDTSSEIKMNSIEEAVRHFKTVRSRLLNVSEWKEFAGATSADFQLVDQHGNEVFRPAQQGDYFRINLPAPGNDTGDGYDWVHIESIEDRGNDVINNELVAIKVRPSKNPVNGDQDTAHFFKEDATSTFIVRRNGRIIKAEVHGRNEQPNTEAEGLTDKIRNIFVAIGAILGFSKVQWKGLVNGIIEK